ATSLRSTATSSSSSSTRPGRSGLWIASWSGCEATPSRHSLSNSCYLTPERIQNRRNPLCPLPIDSVSNDRAEARNNDPQARVGRLPPLFAQGQPEDRQASQSRHFQDARRRREARARRAIFQAALGASRRLAHPA